jgi:hypothetical protein
LVIDSALLQEEGMEGRFKVISSCCRNKSGIPEFSTQNQNTTFTAEITKSWLTHAVPEKRRHQ